MALCRRSGCRSRWPFSRRANGGKLYVATAKGQGNGAEQLSAARDARRRKRIGSNRSRTYIGTLLYGSLAAIDEAEIEKNLPQWTAVVLESNRMKAAAGEDHVCAARAQNPHQACDLHHQGEPHLRSDSRRSEAGRQAGGQWRSEPDDVWRRPLRRTSTSWRCSLACSTTFSIRARFRATGMCGPPRPSERTIWRRPGSSVSRQPATYDYEGVVADGYPLLQKIPDVNEPASGYLWGNLAAHGKTYYHFGEYISTTSAMQMTAADPQLGADAGRARRARTRRSRRARRCPRSGAAA